MRLTIINSLMLLGVTVVCAPDVWSEKIKQGEAEVGAGPVLASSRWLPAAQVNATAPSPSEPDRVYAATPRGLFVSADEGVTWGRVAATGAVDEVFGLAVHPTDAGLVYAGRRDGLWQVRDAGRVWTPLTLPIAGPYIPLAIALAPGRPDVIYVATARQGIFRSNDGGSSWASASRGLPEPRAMGRPEEIRIMVVDPERPDVVYVADQRHGVYRTLDGGASWEAFNRGLPPSVAHGAYPPRLAFEPGKPFRLYLLVTERVHSRLVKSRLYVSIGESGRWLPMEAELPANLQVLGFSVDRRTRALELWTENAVWQIRPPDQANKSR